MGVRSVLGVAHRLAQGNPEQPAINAGDDCAVHDSSPPRSSRCLSSSGSVPTLLQAASSQFGLTVSSRIEAVFLTSIDQSIRCQPATCMLVRQFGQTKN